jgi:hypothetical protein
MVLGFDAYVAQVLGNFRRFANCQGSSVYESR